MNLMLFLLRESKRNVILAVLTGFLSGISSTILLALINSTLHSAAPQAPRLAWGFVGLCLLALCSRVASQSALIYLTQSAVLKLRLTLSQRILATPLRDLEQLGAPRLLATLTDDVNTIANALIIVPVICINAVVVVGCLFYLAWLSPLLLGGTVGFMVLGLSSYQLLSARAIRALRRAREEQDALFTHFRTLTQGTKELKLHSHRRRAFLDRLLIPTSDSFRQHTVVGTIIFIVASSWGWLLFFVFIGLLLFFFPRFLVITPETLTGYTITILYMMTPMEAIMNILPSLGRASVALEKIERLGLSLQPTPGEDLPPGEPAPFQMLELDAVTHAYHREREDSRFTVGPISLTLQPGELVFLIGGNGSGKTTLAKLLVGLYAPESGVLRLNGAPITAQNRDHYRQYFSVVFADYHLFDQLLGIEGPRLDEDGQQYLVDLQLNHKVQLKQGHLSTTDLSQGQRKRLALLTAYLEDRPLYVFDEWASDQDPLFKEIFYLHILPRLKQRGKAVVVISHDDKYFSVADRVLKLDYGHLAEDFDHQPLHTPSPHLAP